MAESAEAITKPRAGRRPQRLAAQSGRNSHAEITVPGDRVHFCSEWRQRSARRTSASLKNCAVDDHTESRQPKTDAATMSARPSTWPCHARTGRTARVTNMGGSTIRRKRFASRRRRLSRGSIPRQEHMNVHHLAKCPMLERLQPVTSRRRRPHSGAVRCTSADRLLKRSAAARGA